MEELKHVGKSYPRSDAIKKVTGAAEYVDDIHLPRMLYAQCVRSESLYGETEGYFGIY